ncbi:MAG: S-adenosylmethionine decarboxylase [Sphingobacteriales bacterium JAD_PAG50586_3]|nr:MAG: S-adenosylmethionine decarboxylase [Sphingobacteriales bacterium JAD_PAG50586_3]
MLLFVTGMTYNPGLHIIAEFDSSNTAMLSSSANFRYYIDNAIASQGLNKLGEFYHEFPDGGFTAVVCLTESHIAIHTLARIWQGYVRCFPV